MNLRNFCSTALSVAAAAALSVPALAQSSSPNSQQPNYPNQQQTYPNQQPSNPSAQQPNYPSGAQQPNYPSNTQQAPNSSDRDRDMAEGQHNWTTDQLITATVHQAWVLSGRNEQNFFEIVRQLAEISARNRNLTLPNDPASGRKAGEYIKEQARADHDQLLYDIVDKAVRMTGTPASPTAAENQPTQ